MWFDSVVSVLVLVEKQESSCQYQKLSSTRKLRVGDSPLFLLYFLASSFLYTSRQMFKAFQISQTAQLMHMDGRAAKIFPNSQCFRVVFSMDVRINFQNICCACKSCTNASLKMEITSRALSPNTFFLQKYKGCTFQVLLSYSSFPWKGLSFNEKEMMRGECVWLMFTHHVLLASLLCLGEDA